MCVCVCLGICGASNWRGAAALGAHMYRCHQLGRWSMPSCWMDPPCVYVYTLPLMVLCPAQPEGGAGWSRWCCLCFVDTLTDHLWPARPAVCLCMYICGSCVCSVCGACWEYIFSLTTSWTCGHRVAAALPPSSCQIQHDILYHDIFGISIDIFLNFEIPNIQIPNSSNRTNTSF